MMKLFTKLTIVHDMTSCVAVPERDPQELLHNRKI